MKKVYLLECGKGRLVNVDHIAYIIELTPQQAVSFIDKANRENTPNFAHPHKPTHLLKVDGVPILAKDISVTDLEEYIGAYYKPEEEPKEEKEK